MPNINDCLKGGLIRIEYHHQKDLHAIEYGKATPLFTCYYASGHRQSFTCGDFYEARLNGKDNHILFNSASFFKDYINAFKFNLLIKKNDLNSTIEALYNLFKYTELAGKGTWYPVKNYYNKNMAFLLFLQDDDSAFWVADRTYLIRYLIEHRYASEKSQAVFTFLINECLDHYRYALIRVMMLKDHFALAVKHWNTHHLMKLLKIFNYGESSNYVSSAIISQATIQYPTKILEAMKLLVTKTESTSEEQHQRHVNAQKFFYNLLSPEAKQALMQADAKYANYLMQQYQPANQQPSSTYKDVSKSLGVKPSTATTTNHVQSQGLSEQQAAKVEGECKVPVPEIPSQYDEQYLRPPRYW